MSANSSILLIGSPIFWQLLNTKNFLEFWLDQTETSTLHIFSLWLLRIQNMKALHWFLHVDVMSHKLLHKSIQSRIFWQFSKLNMSMIFWLDQTETLTLHIFSLWLFRIQNMKALHWFLHVDVMSHKLLHKSTLTLHIYNIYILRIWNMNGLALLLDRKVASTVPQFDDENPIFLAIFKVQYFQQYLARPNWNLNVAHLSTSGIFRIWNYERL